MSDYFHLIFNFFGIGDQVCTTAIPENIYNVTGKKCVITDKRIWTFKYNPYVVFMEEDEAKEYQKINLIPDCRVKSQAETYFNTYGSFVSNSQTEYMCCNMGIHNVKLRHPRLYIHEDVDIIPNKIVVHTTGSDRSKAGEPAIRYGLGEDAVRVMSDEVISAILNNYKNFDIIQIGGKDDKPLGGNSIDMRGKLELFDVAREIATSSRFIGVNFGWMHIANCYPKVDTRVMLQEFSKEALLRYQPGDIRNWLFSWVDLGYSYFNKTENDIGFSYSYKKI